MTNIIKSKWQLVFFVILTIVWIAFYLLTVSDKDRTPSTSTTNEIQILKNQSKGLSNQTTIINQQNVIISNQTSELISN